ncbi:MAG: hypothetical protein J6Q22_03045 [Prevotella sp.]|nr:hypothetical protein [Prevotella sp.]
MESLSSVSWLKSQLAATESLLETVGDSLIMRISLENRINDLKDQINRASEIPDEAKLDVWFSGNAVYGSYGISASFMQNSMQSLVGMIQAAIRDKIRKLKEEKRTVKKPKGEFYITALTKGSFGYELAFKENGALFDDVFVIDSIKHVMGIIDEATNDEIDLDAIIQENPIRLLSNLKDLFVALKKQHSTFRMQSGPQEIVLDGNQVESGFNNICLSDISQKEETIRAVFQGALIETGKFEYTDENGVVRHGYISEDLSNEEIAALIKTYSGIECNLDIVRSIVSYANGKKKENVELLGIAQLES